MYCGPGSSVGIVTASGLDGPGIESPYQRRITSAFYAGPAGRRTGTRDVRPKWETIYQSLNDHVSATCGGGRETVECKPAVHSRCASVVTSMDLQKGGGRIFRAEECRGGSMNSK